VEEDGELTIQERRVKVVCQVRNVGGSANNAYSTVQYIKSISAKHADMCRDMKVRKRLYFVVLLLLL